MNKEKILPSMSGVVILRSSILFKTKKRFQDFENFNKRFLIQIGSKIVFI